MIHITYDLTTEQMTVFTGILTAHSVPVYMRETYDLDSLSLVIEAAVFEGAHPFVTMIRRDGTTESRVLNGGPVTDIVDDEEAAHSVLRACGDTRAHEAGGYVTAVVEAALHADRDNQRRLAQSHPVIVGMVIRYQTVGREELERIAGLRK